MSARRWGCAARVLESAAGLGAGVRYTGNPSGRCRSQRRCFFASLLAGGVVTSLLAPLAVQAQDATWKGTSSGEWGSGSNWSSAPFTPTGTATFTTGAARTLITNSDPVSKIGSIVFTNVPNAPSYTFRINQHFTFNGAGIANNSTSIQTFNVNDSIAFDSGSANSGNGTVNFSSHLPATLLSQIPRRPAAPLSITAASSFFKQHRGGQCYDHEYHQQQRWHNLLF